MKIANIMPICFLKTYGRCTDYHMVLTHLFVKSNKYNNFFYERGLNGDFIILDSSVLETGYSAPLQSMIDIANFIKAKELILPDVLNNHKDTIKKIKNALSEFKKRESKLTFQLMGVPQGENSNDWLECLAEILEFEEITTIGIPRLVCNFKELKEGRYELIKKAIELKLLPSGGKNYHLLGMGKTINEEIKIANEFSFIRGVDSRMATICAINGLNIYEGRKDNWEFDFFESFDLRDSLIKKNIDDLKKELKY